jgi:hypothetical protein
VTDPMGEPDDDTIRCVYCRAPVSVGFPPCSCEAYGPGGAAWSEDASPPPRPRARRARADTRPREVSVAADDELGFNVQTFEGEEAAKVHRSVLLFGESGSGKTAAVCRAAADLDLDLEDIAYGRVTPVGDDTIFYLALERNGLATARLVNPKIRFTYADPFNEEGRPDSARALATAVSVIRAAATGRLQERFGTRLLVVDGLTELQRLEKDVIVDGNRSAKEGRSVRDYFDQDDWGFLNEKSRRMLNTLRALPLDLACTALEESYESRQSGVEKMSPKFEGKKISGEAMSFYSACGRMDKIVSTAPDGRELVAYRAMFTGPSRYRVKSNGALLGWQKPCVQAWFQVLNGERDPESTRIRSEIVDPERPGGTPGAAAEGAAAQPTHKRPAGSGSARSARATS